MVQRGFLHCHVRFYVEVRRRGTFMAQPERDHFWKNARLEHVHCCRVAKRMGRYRTPTKGWAKAGGATDSLGEAESNAGPREWLAESIGEQRLIRSEGVAANPVAKETTSGFPERYHSLFPTFAPQLHRLELIRGHVLNPQMNDLRDASAGVVEQPKQQSIPSASVCRGAGSVHHRLNLFFGEKAEKRSGEPLYWDGEDLLNLLAAVSAVKRQDVVRKGPKRGQTEITSAGAIAPFLFEVVQESEDRVCSKIRQVQPDRRYVMRFFHVLQEEFKCVPISRNGFRANIPLIHKVLGKEALQ